MFEALLTVLGAGLSIWEHKEKTKYVDKLMSLRRQYKDEMNKSESNRSDAVLDNLEFELNNLALAFSAQVVNAKSS